MHDSANTYSWISISCLIFRPHIRSEPVHLGRRQEVHQRDGERPVGNRPQADRHVGLGLEGGRNTFAHHHGGKQGTFLFGITLSLSLQCF